jgi:hypothetical protein
MPSRGDNSKEIDMTSKPSGTHKEPKTQPPLEEPDVEAGESAAGGSPEYEPATTNKPKVENLRDNYYAIYREKKE